MITNISRSWSAVVFGVTTLSAAVLLSQTASPPQSEEFKSDEYLILGSPNRGAGEPMVFVNPKDSNNIIVVAMATLNRLPTGETPLPRGGGPGAPGAPGSAGAAGGNAAAGSGAAGGGAVTGGTSVTQWGGDLAHTSHWVHASLTKANAAKLALAWLAAHRSGLAKKPKTAPTNIDSINVPNCPSGKPRGLKLTVTASTQDGAIADVDCSSAITDVTNDIEGFNAGYAVQAPVSVTPATPAS